jgi:hypothetical protein
VRSRFASAAALLAAALALAPSEAPAQDALGQYEELENQLRYVEQEHGRADETREQRARRKLSDAETQFLLQNWRSVVVLLYDAVDVPEFRASADYPKALYCLGESLHQEGDYKTARAHFRQVLAIPATTNAKKLKQALNAKLVELKEVAPLHNEVERYKRPDWTLAAFFRQAHLLERLAQTLYDAPVPPEFKRNEEYLAAYQDQLARFAQPYEEQAVQVYVQALHAARELHVTNEWTKKIQESLARYRPREYPILKEAKGRMLLEDTSPAPLAESPEPRRPAAVEPVARAKEPSAGPGSTPGSAEGSAVATPR